MQYMLQNTEKRKWMANNASAHIAKWTLENEAYNIKTAWEKVLTEKFVSAYS
jgi:hypothetical protein